MAMDWWWWIIPAAVAVFGVAFVLSGLGWMFRGKPFKGGRGVVSGGAMLAISAVASLIGMNIQTYNRLSYERPVATVALASQGGRVFVATVTEINEDGTPASAPRVYEIEGDQWQMDARVITWRPWANVIGLDSQYELQRIWGRNIIGPNRNTAKAEDLVVERPGLDFMAVAEGLGRYSPIEIKEREFGSAVYMPMVDGAVYAVKITQEGLAVDASNDVARGAIAAGALGRAALEAAGVPTNTDQSAPVGQQR